MNISKYFVVGCKTIYYCSVWIDTLWNVTFEINIYSTVINFGIEYLDDYFTPFIATDMN